MTTDTRNSQDKAKGANLTTGLNEHADLNDSVQGSRHDSIPPDQKPRAVDNGSFKGEHRDGRTFNWG